MPPKQSTNITPSHAPILALQQEMLNDAKFKHLCLDNRLPWDPENGYEPRWYNGPAPEQVKVLVLMAEPGAITKTEQPGPAIDHAPWIGTKELKLQQYYWLANLLYVCEFIWPQPDTEAMMDQYLAGSCTFWMSLPVQEQTKPIPKVVLSYFLDTYLKRFLKLFPNAVILAAGGKAQDRLHRIEADFIPCSAFTRPESNKEHARESWQQAGLQIAAQLFRDQA